MAVVFYSFLLLALTNTIASFKVLSSAQASGYDETEQGPTPSQYNRGGRQNSGAVDNSHVSFQYKTVDYDVSYSENLINRCQFRNNIIISCKTINKYSNLNQNEHPKGKQNPVMKDKGKGQNPVAYDDIYSGNGKNRENVALEKNRDLPNIAHASRTQIPVKVENTIKGHKPDDDIVINIGNGINRENTVIISQKRGFAPDTLYANTYEKNDKPKCLTRNGIIVRPGNGECEESNPYYPNEYSDSQSGINSFKERSGSNILNIGNGRNNDNIVTLRLH